MKVYTEQRGLMLQCQITSYIAATWNHALAAVPNANDIRIFFLFVIHFWEHSMQTTCVCIYAHGTTKQTGGLINTHANDVQPTL